MELYLKSIGGAIDVDRGFLHRPANPSKGETGTKRHSYILIVILGVRTLEVSNRYFCYVLTNYRIHD